MQELLVFLATEEEMLQNSAASGDLEAAEFEPEM